MRDPAAAGRAGVGVCGTQAALTVLVDVAVAGLELAGRARATGRTLVRVRVKVAVRLFVLQSVQAIHW